MSIVNAAFDNDIDTVKLLIYNGADVNQEDRDKMTALVFASMFGYIDIMNVLIQHGADISKGSPLSNAVKHIDAVKLLIYNGADVNAPDEFGMTPLMCAVDDNGCIESVKYLIANGANVNAVSKNYTALKLAIEDDNIEIAKYLINSGAYINIGDEFIRAPNNFISSTLEWIKNGKIGKKPIRRDSRIGRRTPLMCAVESGNLDMIKLLVHTWKDKVGGLIHDAWGSVDGIKLEGTIIYGDNTVTGAVGK
jgi:ankyrin repeat protein